MPEAAAALDIHPATLRRWIDAGAPVARRGGRGRGKRTLIDVPAVQAWRGQRASDLVFASEIPELLAEAAWTAFRLTEGNDKARIAGVLVGTWTVATTTLLDHLRERDSEIPALAVTPEKIERLRAIFSKSG